MALVRRVVTEYVCDSCQSSHRPLSNRIVDTPSGYLLQVRRISQAHRHTETPVVWLCSKDCMEDFVRFRVSAFAQDLATPESGSLKMGEE